MIKHEVEALVYFEVERLKWYFCWAVVGLMDRALDLKLEVTQSCGFESRLRKEVHDCSPGAAQSAAHCSKCVHLDGLNAENTFHSSLYSV